MTLEEAIRSAFDLASSPVAKLWRLVEVAPDGSTIETPENIDPKVLRTELFNLREICQAIYRESVDMLSPDEALRDAAVEYLGKEKAGILLSLYGENVDQLTEEAVCAAKLGVLKPRGASARFEAAEELLAGVRTLAAAEPPGFQSVSEEALTWDRACRLGWLDALPIEFYLTRLGPWENDEMFARRCITVLMDLIKLFPSDGESQ